MCRLTKLRQTETVKEFITPFEQLVIHTIGLEDYFYTKYFINGLKEAIRVHVCMQHPTSWLEACARSLEEKTILNSQNPLPSFSPKSKSLPTRNMTPPLKVHCLSREEMEEMKHKDLCYNCDENIVKGHRCRE